MAKSKKSKPGSVGAYLEFKAVFREWLSGERESADRAWRKSLEKLEIIRPEVVAAMRRANLSAKDFSFDNPNIDAETMALLEQYTTLNLEHELAVARMVAVQRTTEGNYGPAFEAFLASDQHFQFLHLAMVKEMFA